MIYWDNWYHITKKRSDFTTKMYDFKRKVYDLPRKLIWYNEKRFDLTKIDMILRENVCFFAVHLTQIDLINAVFIKIIIIMLINDM